MLVRFAVTARLEVRGSQGESEYDISELRESPGIGCFFNSSKFVISPHVDDYLYKATVHLCMLEVPVKVLLT